jgi:hypothetical protein
MDNGPFSGSVPRWQSHSSSAVKIKMYKKITVTPICIAFGFHKVPYWIFFVDALTSNSFVVYVTWAIPKLWNACILLTCTFIFIVSRSQVLIYLLYLAHKYLHIYCILLTSTYIFIVSCSQIFTYLLYLAHKYLHIYCILLTSTYIFIVSCSQVLIYLFSLNFGFDANFTIFGILKKYIMLTTVWKQTQV